MEPQFLEFKMPWPLVNLEEEDGELVVRFHPEGFLWPSVEEVGNILLNLVDETDGKFVLDLGYLDYLSGSGLEKIVLLKNKLAAIGRSLVLKNVGPKLQEIISLTGLTRELAIPSTAAFRPTV